LKTAPQLRVGTQVAFVAYFLGRRLAYTYEIVEWVPGDRFVMPTADGPFANGNDTRKLDADGGTPMTLRNRGEPSGFSRLMAPLMSVAMRKANRTDLARLKELLECSPDN